MHLSTVGLGRFGCFNFGSFGSVFNLKYSVLVFFGFGIRTPLQCKSILVCENTKTESVNFHKKFQLNYIDRPRLV